MGLTNKQIVETTHLEFLVDCVLARLSVLANFSPNEGASPTDLLRRGLCDAVRLFVKNEPHKLAKLLELRFRLIASISLVDQVCERILFGPQNRWEIDHHKRLSSKAGLGLDDEGLISLFRAYEEWDGIDLLSSDMSGWDWSVKYPEMWAFADFRAKWALRCGASAWVARAMYSRIYCQASTVFNLSDGTLYAQNFAGVVKSGCYTTSAGNSYMRALLARSVGAGYVMANGDDCVEQHVEGYQAKYARLGKTIKNDERAEEFAGRIEFCSHYFFPRADRTVLTAGDVRPLNWAKTLYRFLSRRGVAESERAEGWHQLEMELRHCPERWAVLESLELGGCKPELDIMPQCVVNPRDQPDPTEW
jgi:hypothetical protein